MPWTAKGDAACDVCGAIRACVSDRSQAIQMMRTGGWRHMTGKTLGDQDFETILCPPCVKGEYRRTRAKPEGVQEELPLIWEEPKRAGGKEGIQSR